MSNKILLVDDETNIRRSYKRSLYGQFNLETAASGQEGLALLADEGPFAVVISDMRMPVMNGIQFLTEVKAMFPDTVRMMLTGNADLQTVLNAVNKGYLFRFLVKPCSLADMTEALTTGLEQYRLRTAERDVLEKTLKGSIELLTDVLNQLNPVAFKRTVRLRTIVQKLVSHLKLEDAWQYELAAM
ncbi:MAG: response regulator, partial [Anaerolineae bacterium]|nr:response regulator [Anaerolineae bacterium]